MRATRPSVGGTCPSLSGRTAALLALVAMLGCFYLGMATTLYLQAPAVTTDKGRTNIDVYDVAALTRGASAAVDSLSADEVELLVSSLRTTAAKLAGEPTAFARAHRLYADLDDILSFTEQARFSKMLGLPVQAVGDHVSRRVLTMSLLLLLGDKAGAGVEVAASPSPQTSEEGSGLLGTVLSRFRGEGAGPAGGSSGAAAAASAASATVWPRRAFTDQVCHSTADETEMCFYTGTLCTDGLHAVVVGDTAAAAAGDKRRAGHSHAEEELGGGEEQQSGQPPAYVELGLDPWACPDVRFDEAGWQEPSSSGGATACDPLRIGSRPVVVDESVPRAPAVDAALRSDTGVMHPAPGASPAPALWGPASRGRTGPGFVMVPPSGVYRGPKDVPPRPGSAASGALGGAGPTLPAPRDLPASLSVAASYALPNGRRIDWLPEGDPLWLVGLEDGAAADRYSWMMRAGVLYEARRNNMTEDGEEFGGHPNDAFVHRMRRTQIAYEPTSSRSHRTRNRLRWVIGPQWDDVPPLKTLVFTGPGASQVPDAGALSDWGRSVLSVAIGPSANPYFSDVADQLMAKKDDEGGPGRLLCSTRGAVLGPKLRLFTSRGDHWMYRSYAYEDAGLMARNIHPHNKYPPRTITILDSPGVQGGASGTSGRAGPFVNRDAVVAAFEATGVPVTVVPDIQQLSFTESMELMASTGVLVAAHGADLVHLAFLPAHAVVVEVFPPGIKSARFTTLSSLAGVIYFPLYARDPVEDDAITDSAASACAGLVNATGYEVHATNPRCALLLKQAAIRVPEDQLAAAMADIMDSIAAYSLRNPELVGPDASTVVRSPHEARFPRKTLPSPGVKVPPGVM